MTRLHPMFLFRTNPNMQNHLTQPTRREIQRGYAVADNVLVGGTLAVKNNDLYIDENGNPEDANYGILLGLRVSIP